MLRLISTLTINNNQITEWLETVIRPAIDTILTDWADFAKRLRSGEFYSTITIEERAAIAKAVASADFGQSSVYPLNQADISLAGTSGRFYQVCCGRVFDN